MKFHIASRDGLGPDAFWNVPQQYTDNPVRYGATYSTPGGDVHDMAPVAISDRRLVGAGTVLKAELADVLLVRNSPKLDWEFTDGASLYLVKIARFDVTPIGGGHARLDFEFRVVRKLK